MGRNRFSVLVAVIVVVLVGVGIGFLARPAYASVPPSMLQSGDVEEPAATEEVTPTSLPNAAPLRNYYTTAMIVLTWNSVAWAAQYEVQISQNSNFTSLVPTGGPVPADSLDFLTPVLPNGTYYWRVRAIRADGVQGSWSGIEPFTVAVNLVPPPATGTSTPAQGNEDNHTPTPTVTLTFTPSPTHTPTYTNQPSFTPSPTYTPSPTHTPTYTLEPSFTPSSTYTPSPTPQASFTPSPTFTPTLTFTPSRTGTQTITPTLTPTKTRTPNPTLTKTATVYPPPTPPGGGCVDNCD